MSDLGSTAFQAGVSIAAMWAAAHLVTAGWWPDIYLRYFDFNDIRHRKPSCSPIDRPSYKLTHVVGSGAALIGGAVFMYHAADAFLLWVPLEEPSQSDFGLRTELQILGAVCLWACIFPQLDRHVHRLVRPFQYRLSLWATSGYYCAEDQIGSAALVEQPNLRDKQAEFAVEFSKGFRLRLEEQAKEDVARGRLRLNLLGHDTYRRTFSEAVSDLRDAGWKHARLDAQLASFMTPESKPIR